MTPSTRRWPWRPTARSRRQQRQRRTKSCSIGYSAVWTIRLQPRCRSRPPMRAERLPSSSRSRRSSIIIIIIITIIISNRPPLLMSLRYRSPICLLEDSLLSIISSSLTPICMMMMLFLKMVRLLHPSIVSLPIWFRVF